jgi:hypothetical protein
MASEGVPVPDASPTESHGLSSPREGAHVGRPGLLVEYATLIDARKAIEALESQGVDGDDLSLAGDAAVLAERASNRERSDSRLLSSVTAVIALGGLVGALAGAVIGAILIGVIIAVAPGLTATGWVFGLLTAWFAAGGSLLGAFTQVSRRTGFSESWPLTFEDAPVGAVWLAVYGHGEDVRPTIDTTRPIKIRTDAGVDAMHPDLAAPRPGAAA